MAENLVYDEFYDVVKSVPDLTKNENYHFHKYETNAFVYNGCENEKHYFSLADGR